MNSSKIKQILKTRAKELAEEPKEDKAKGEYLEIIEFVLAYERYGIESSYVREVYPLKNFTPIPCTPPFVVGVSNIRGQILSVLNIKEFFGLPREGLSNLNRVIIVHMSDMEVGILADAIVGIRMIPPGDIQPSLPTLTDKRAEYLRGVTADRLVILDIKKIFSDPNIIVHEEVET